MNEEKHLTDVRFDSFGPSDAILAGVKDAGFVYCTPIQAATLPPALAGQDVAGQAQTGTGKTAAFLLAALHQMEKHPPSERRRPNQPLALMVAPTRELAIQIEKDARVLAGHTPYKVEVVYGGTGYESQRNAVREGVDILIGTPGRLIDYFKQKVYDLREVRVVVLDEADRMFDLGFIKDIRFLLRRCPPPDKRLGMLFSATLSFRIKELAYEHMNNPKTIEIEPDKVTADRIEEQGFMTANDEKIPLLIGLLRQWQDARTIVFVNTKRAADQVWGFLQGNGIETAVLSGDVPQKKRMSLLKKFTEGGLDVLVATDVAARGLHIPDVTHVVNYDLPEDAEDYVHRIGRTGRAGAAGKAISFACETHAFSLPDVEAYIGHSIPMSSVPQELLAEVDPSSRIRTPRKPRQHNGRRGSNRGRSDNTRTQGSRKRRQG
ncbi:ATP-dependent RNA helicase RhlB [Thiolapillus sp.]|uniref:ATP-dependent RNA helicase RhlB n=1 Tax=Thiolapillus sp. TaxID=2017437 RepID=UPI0025D857B9|nr:ATP-dependent RNA helicase RhlB [Thiolapillus sp.]